MSKSVLYAANTNPQTVVAAGSVINFGSIIRRYGCNCNLSGSNATVEGTGYYAVDTNVTFTGAAASTVVVQLYKDGVAIPGAVATSSIAANGIGSVTIPTIVRERCCVESTITAMISGLAGTVTNASIRVIKL